MGVEEVAAVFVEEAVRRRVGGTIENEELRVRGRGLVRGWLLERGREGEREIVRD